MDKKLFLCLSLAASAVGVQAQQVTFYTPQTVRIVKQAPDTSLQTGLSLVVKAQPEAVKVKISNQNGKKVYTSQALVVEVDEQAQRVTFKDRKGQVLMAEGDNAFTPIGEGPDKGRYRVRQGFALDPDEPIYGLGMLQNGKMNQRGEKRKMMQSNLEDYAHFFQSIKGYGIYWDNYSPTDIRDDGQQVALESQVGTSVDYYFLYGGGDNATRQGSMADGVIRQMRQLTGHVPMLPLWTYGFHQSRERYKSSKELTEVLDTYRRTGVPLDGIIQDWQYWGNNYLWNAMEFLSEDFSDYKQMVKHIHDSQAHLSISIWAAFGPHTKPFKQLQEKGLLYSFQTWPQSGLPFWPPHMDYPSGVRVYDPYSADARAIYWQNLRRLKDAGVDAWWMDSTDPDHHSYKESDLDEVKPITDPATGRDIMGSYRSVRNAFPLCTVEGVYEQQRRDYPDRRVFILTRSYFAGQQRTGANTWSGDVGSSWDSFRKQVPLCLNYTLTANPNVNTDIGGFFANAYNRRHGDNSATRNPLFQELYVRWMQFGLFCPMMRSHGTEVWREIYHYGEPGDPVYDALLGAIKMRYQLLPYIYSQSWQVCQNDDSFMRALMMDFPQDKKVWNMAHEFMFGPSLLVAPVVKALFTPEKANQTNEISGWDPANKSLFQEGFRADWSAPKTYDVYLPAGAEWYDYWTGQRLQGGQTVKADAPLAHSPLYVRAGSIVPLCKKEVNHADVADWQSLDIQVYPGRDADFTLYEDEGDGYGYEQGQRSTIRLHWNDRVRRLTIDRRQGNFPGMSVNRSFNVNVVGGKSQTVSYSGKAVTVKF